MKRGPENCGAVFTTSGEGDNAKVAVSCAGCILGKTIEAILPDKKVRPVRKLEREAIEYVLYNCSGLGVGAKPFNSVEREARGYNGFKALKNGVYPKFLF